MGRGVNCTAAIACWLLGGALAAPMGLPVAAVAQQTPAAVSPAPQAPPADQAATASVQGAAPQGDVLTPSNLFQLFTSVRTAPGTGPDGTLRTVTTDTLMLRADSSVVLSSDWRLALRGDLPFVGRDPFTATNPDADFLYGLGDAFVQSAVIHDIDARWTAGFGARLIMPTGDDNLGSGKWQVMPIAGVRYALPEISQGSYVEPLMRYVTSVAGDPSRRSISNLQFAPMVNFSLPDAWFFVLYPSPDIRWNFGPPITGQTGRLFVPFNARVGRRFNRNLSVSLEVGVPIIKQYPIYDFTTELRININF